MSPRPTKKNNANRTPSYIDPDLLASHMEEANPGEFEAFYGEFVAESDRAAVVLGAAKIDDILANILSARLIPAANRKSDELLHLSNPIGTMSARIDLVYRLGLISEEFRRALHLIRKIRNTFAHDLEGCSFEKAAVRSQTQQLFAPYEGRLFTRNFMLRFGSDDSTGCRFRTVLAIHMHRLNTLSKLIQTIDESEGWTILMPNWERLKERGLLRAEDLAPELLENGDG